MEVLFQNKSISLNIEERAILLPVEISQEDIERSNHYSPDPEFQAKLHASLDVYWQSNVGYVPSPDGPRPVRFFHYLLYLVFV